VSSLIEKWIGEDNNHAQNQEYKIIIHLNPANTNLFIQGLSENISQYDIVNIFG
jgi:hypothetical protein